MSSNRKILIFATFLALATWIVPILRPIGLPLVYLNTHFHELFHAFAALMTGGRVDSIAVFADGSGQTPVTGGYMLLVASAGYVCSTILGGFIVVFSTTPRGAQLVMRALGVLLALSVLIWVRSDAIGVLSGLLWALTLILGGRFAQGEVAMLCARFIGVQQALNGLQSLVVLFNLSMAGHRQNDAGLMADLTGLPPIFWALLWSVLSIAITLVSLLVAWHADDSRVKSPRTLDRAGPLPPY